VLPGIGGNAIMLDGISYFLIPGAIACNHINGNWLISTCENDSNGLITMHIEFNHGDFFGHWVFESAPYLSEFRRLKNIYPELKLHLPNMKMYKRLFLDYFGIPITDIISRLPPRGVIIVPQYSTSLVLPNELEYFKNILNRFGLSFPQQYQVPGYGFLILPRQSAESRVKTITGEDLSSLLDDVIAWFASSYIAHRVLHTDTITRLRDQIELIQSYNNLILLDGSALLVNGLFVINTTIHVVGNLCTEIQGTMFPKIQFNIDDIMSRGNSIVYYYDSADFIKRIELKFPQYHDKDAE